MSYCCFFPAPHITNYCSFRFMGWFFFGGSDGGVEEGSVGVESLFEYDVNNVVWIGFFATIKSSGYVMSMGLYFVKISCHSRTVITVPHSEDMSGPFNQINLGSVWLATSNSKRWGRDVCGCFQEFFCHHELKLKIVLIVCDPRKDWNMFSYLCLFLCIFVILMLTNDCMDVILMLTNKHT